MAIRNSDDVGALHAAPSNLRSQIGIRGLQLMGIGKARAEKREKAWIPARHWAALV
jgi:hypothetical protein